MNPLQAALPIARHTAFVGSPLRDLGADLVNAGLPLPGGLMLTLPNSADQCTHIRAFAAHCADKLDLHHASSDDERHFRIGEEVGLMLQHGVNPSALRGAIALCKAGVLPYNLPGQGEDENWAHYLAQHGFDAPRGFADTQRTPPMSLQERFAALADAGVSFNAQGDAPPAIMAAVQADNTTTLEALLSPDAPEQTLTHDGLSLLHYAAAHDAIDAFDALLGRGFSTGIVSEENVTPLHLAAANGSLKVLARLLRETDTYIDARSLDGHSALHLAATQGQTGAARLLTQAGAATGLMDSQGESAIHLATRNGHAEVVALLLGSDLQSLTLSTLEGDTPMHIAARHGHTAIMAMLTRTRRDTLTAENHHGRLPLHVAAEAGELQAVEWLLAIAPEALNIEDRLHDTPIYLAVRQGQADVFRLLDNRADLDRNLISNQTESLLAEAAGAGHISLVRELALTPGFDINALGFLKMAILYGTPTLLGNLVQAPGLDLNRKDLRGETPLNMAVRLGKTDMARELLKAPGIDVNETTPNGHTALHLAAKNGDNAIVSLLLRDGRIDRSKQNLAGKTAADLAAERGYESTHQLLHDEPPARRPSPSRAEGNPLHRAIMRGNVARVVMLSVDPKTDINKKDPQGRTALHLATTRSDPLLTRSLLSNPGIRINDRGPDARTALHLAAHDGNAQVLRHLLAMPDIDVGALSDRGWTPLHEAAAAGNLDAVRTLITDRRVRPAGLTPDGHNARSLAREANQTQTVALLNELPVYRAGADRRSRIQDTLARVPGVGWLFGR